MALAVQFAFVGSAQAEPVAETSALSEPSVGSDSGAHEAFDVPIVAPASLSGASRPDEPAGTFAVPALGDSEAIPVNRNTFDLASFSDAPRAPLLSVDEPASGFAASEAYGLRTFGRQARSIPWEIGGMVAAVTVAGFTTFDWGNSRSFRFQSEGFFDRESSSLGLDKFGHAYSTYLITEFLGGAIRRKAPDARGAEVTAAALAMGVMTYIEVFDGFAADHGFSYEDMVANAAGAGFSILRNSVPGLKQKLDFRLLYVPSGNRKGFHPITDYSGQRYVFALKLAGFDAVARTPLRFVELQTGYSARGFTDEEAARGERRRRMPFVGVGLNVGELLFGHRGSQRSKPARWGRTVLDYVQVPYTAVYSR